MTAPIEADRPIYLILDNGRNRRTGEPVSQGPVIEIPASAAEVSINQHADGHIRLRYADRQVAEFTILGGELYYQNVNWQSYHFLDPTQSLASYQHRVEPFIQACTIAELFYEPPAARAITTRPEEHEPVLEPEPEPVQQPAITRARFWLRQNLKEGSDDAVHE